jgi:hypothetical protein
MKFMEVQLAMPKKVRPPKYTSANTRSISPHRTDADMAVSYGMQSSGKSHTLTLTHRKNHFAADITFSYESSSDTMAWIPLNGVTPTVVALDAQTDAVSICTSSTNAASPGG